MLFDAFVIDKEYYRSYFQYPPFKINSRLFENIEREKSILKN